ncbi:MAG: hypothetical protein AAB400_00630 [Patescibacteria group bacterium]
MPPLTAPSASPTLTASGVPTTTPSIFSTPQPTTTPSSSPSASVPSTTPTPTPTPSAPQGVLGVTFDNAVSPIGFISYGEKKRFASYRLTMSGEDFTMHSTTISWRNATSQNTSLLNVVLSIGTESVTTYSVVDATRSTRSFNLLQLLAKDTVKLLHVDGTLADGAWRGGSNPGDRVSIALHGIGAVAVQSANSATKEFTPPLMSNTLTVVPFTIRTNSSSPSGMQTPQSAATIGIWDFLLPTLSEMIVRLKGVRIGINGSDSGPLKNVSLMNKRDDTLLGATLSTLSVGATADIAFTVTMPLTNDTVESFRLRADTTSYKQASPGGTASLGASLIGYTLEDRANPGKDIFIDLSSAPEIAPTLIF